MDPAAPPPPPPPAASAPPSGFCTSAWLEQEEWTSPAAAPEHAAAPAAAEPAASAAAPAASAAEAADGIAEKAYAAGAAEAAAASAARAPSSGWSGFLTDTAFDALLERKFRTEKLLDEALQKLDASERRCAELERRVKELEAAAAAPAAASAKDTEAELARKKAESVHATRQLVLTKDAAEGAAVEAVIPHFYGPGFQAFVKCKISGDARAPPGTATARAELPETTNQGSVLYYVYDEYEQKTNVAYVRVGQYSCKLRFQNGVLGCLVPNFPSNGGDTPSPTHWESIKDIQWVPKSVAKEPSAASNKRKRGL